MPDGYMQYIRIFTPKVTCWRDSLVLTVSKGNSNEDVRDK